MRQRLALAVLWAVAAPPSSAFAHDQPAPQPPPDHRLIEVPRVFGLASAPPGARLRLSDRTAGSGTLVRLRGRGFTPLSRAMIGFAGRRLRVVGTSARGSLRTAIRIPFRPPGVYTVSARTGRRLVRVRFRIPAPRPPTPAPANLQAPSQAPPSSSVDGGSSEGLGGSSGGSGGGGAPPPDPVTLVAAGDIACAPGNPTVGLTGPQCRHAGTSDRVLALAPDVVALLGDIQYETGTAAAYMAPGAYNDTWGRFKSITWPAVGNHEYQGDPERDSANGYYGYFGTAAGDPSKGYYAYDVGDWRAIVLNTGALDSTLPGGVNSALPDDCYPVSCTAASEQVTWLRNELASLPPSKCVVAYWHHPRYDSLTRFSYDELIPIYDALYDGGAELALTGHDHSYERFAPMTADNTLDASFGVRQFIVGVGGKDRRFEDPTPPLATGSEFREPNRPVSLYGVLEFELKPTGYEARLVGEDGAIRDQSSGSCHGRPAP